MAWILDNFAAICAVIVSIISAVLSILAKKGINASTPGAAGDVYTALKVAVNMLPSLITFSENANEGKSGEAKKAFVITFIENMYAGRGLTMSDDDKKTIGTYIDEIVAATKAMHVGIGVKKNEENQRNDISGITGLRSIT